MHFSSPKQGAAIMQLWIHAITQRLCAWQEPLSLSLSQLALIMKRT